MIKPSQVFFGCYNYINVFKLYPQLDAINPRMFGCWSDFAKKYCDAGYQWFGKQKRWRTE